MNIVHVVESLALGGLERVVVSLAQTQLVHGHRVLVVCLFHEGVLATQLRERGAEVLACHKTKGWDLRALRRMRNSVRGFAADVVHTHNPMAHYYATVATRGLGLRRLVNTRHGMGAFPISWRREILSRLALTHTDAAVSVCDAATRRFVAHRIIPRRKALTVRNGTDVSAFEAHDPAARRALIDAFDGVGEPIVFGTVGRLSAAKDHATLLDAMRRLIDSGANAVLVIVGDGELRRDIEDLRRRLDLDARVHLLGARSDIPELLSAFDAFVLSSLTEGYSLALVEACAAGLPCIVTDVGGNTEIVRNQVSGLVVPSANPEALASAMRELCNRAGLRAV